MFYFLILIVVVYFYFSAVLSEEGGKGTSELLGTRNTYVPLASSDHKGYSLRQLRQESL